jgi:uncharacterized coiled-coil DUF342 family protein
MKIEITNGVETPVTKFFSPETEIHSCHDQCQKAMCVLRRERDKWEETARLYCQNSDYHREMREKAERERDEARAERDSLRIDAQREAENHDRMVGELEGLYEQIEAMNQRLREP